MLLRGPHAAYSISPYVDDHGEEDPGLRRGRPLHLDRERMSTLARLWASHSIVGEVVRERGITMVGESGIFTIDDVNVLQEAGVGCLLVGESLVKQDTPDVGIKKLYGRPLD